MDVHIIHLFLHLYLCMTILPCMYTGNALREDVQDFFGAGCNHHLLKPIRPPGLFAAIEEVVHRLDRPGVGWRWSTALQANTRPAGEIARGEGCGGWGDGPYIRISHNLYHLFIPACFAVVRVICFSNLMIDRTPTRTCLHAAPWMWWIANSLASYYTSMFDR